MAASSSEGEGTGMPAAALLTYYSCTLDVPSHSNETTHPNKLHGTHIVIGVGGGCAVSYLADTTSPNPNHKVYYRYSISKDSRGIYEQDLNTIVQ